MLCKASMGWIMVYCGIAVGVSLIVGVIVCAVFYCKKHGDDKMSDYAEHKKSQKHYPARTIAEYRTALRRHFPMTGRLR